MKKILGIFILLVSICVITTIMNPNFLNPFNVHNTLRWIGLFGVIGIGVSFVIISSGIDLSIGSVIALTGALLVQLLTAYNFSVPMALFTCMGLSLVIGVVHGLLITKLKLKPFIVTLCGLLIYRSLARLATDDQSIGFGNEYEGLRVLALGSVPLPGGYSIPFPFIIFLVLSIIAMILLNKTLYGRYLLALGRNEEAVRFSGINADRIVLISYVICSLMGGLAGILFTLDLNSVQPASSGNFYELYAIAAAVLGGCSLRGGEGSIIGVMIGTAILRVLTNSITLLHIPDYLEFAIIGIVILIGVSTDEVVRKYVSSKKVKA